MEKLEQLLIGLVEVLAKNGKKVSTMESCTGGGLANAITNIAGSSEVFNFGAVTYSNDFKVKMGVNEKIIDEFSVYSRQTADEMSRAICAFTGADFGVGITGKLKRLDPHNLSSEDDLVFISVFDKNQNLFYNKSIQVQYETRQDNKNMVIKSAVTLLLTAINANI